jgi:hypothetical protein
MRDQRAVLSDERRTCGRQKATGFVREVNPDLVAAVFRICCATVIGTLISAPLGALAAQEHIIPKMRKPP